MPLLVDGHNLIGQMNDISLDDPDDEVKLLRRLRSYHAHTGKSITVFFDSGGLYHPPQDLSGGGVKAVFAPLGSSADALIVRRIRRSRNPRGLRVVSSDQEVIHMAQKRGAQITTASAFAAELSQLGTVMTSPEGTEKPLGDRLSDEEIAEWLEIFDRIDGE